MYSGPVAEAVVEHRHGFCFDLPPLPGPVQTSEAWPRRQAYAVLAVISAPKKVSVPTTFEKERENVSPRFWFGGWLPGKSRRGSAFEKAEKFAALLRDAATLSARLPGQIPGNAPAPHLLTGSTGENVAGLAD
jgi:hypothetical protein